MTSMPSKDPTARARDRTGVAVPRDRRSLRCPDRPATQFSRRGLTSAAVLLVIAYLGLTALWAGLGFLVTGPLADTWVGTMDQTVATGLVEQRTPTLDAWSRAGTMLADTRVKIIVTAVLAAAMFLAWRSWREPLLICCALILEAAVFITVTGLVGRPRPDVAALDDVSVGTSFPSGHAAAAAAYSAIAVVIFERTRNRWIRAITVLTAIAVPLIVGIGRMYRGVHYLTDVIAGIPLGVVCVAATYVLLRSFEIPGSRRRRFTGSQQPRRDRR
jgi:membrane-associated phospholipid phosphatase